MALHPDQETIRPQETKHGPEMFIEFPGHPGCSQELQQKLVQTMKRQVWRIPLGICVPLPNVSKMWE